MKIAVVVATDNKNGIGIGNTIPWRFKKDIDFFKKITIGIINEEGTDSKHKLNSVIMGRKTWESIPQPFKPLIKRVSIVVSSKKNQVNYENTFFVNTIELAINLAEKKSNEIFIIGGEKIYNLFLKYELLIKCLYLTEINRDFHCNKFFPRKSYLKFLTKKKILKEETEKKVGLLFYKFYK